jgi:hypothetical protein
MGKRDPLCRGHAETGVDAAGPDAVLGKEEM